MCFEDEQSALDALKGKKMIKNTVVVLRTRGPAGAPGMPEQLKLSGAIMGESWPSWSMPMTAVAHLARVSLDV